MNIWFLICIGVFALFGLVLVATLLRGTRAVRDSLKEGAARVEQGDGPGDANTRWAHGDTGSATKVPKKAEAIVSCLSCGGENPAGTSSCSYCGRKL